MLPTRVQKQYNLAVYNHNAIVGSRFRREPADSTLRYTRWANGLTPAQLTMQIYTSNGPTVVMPTWFIHRSVFNRVGGFSEAGAGTPEDLIFFYNHLRKEGSIIRHDEELLVYRYHPNATTFSIHEETIWDLRVKEIQERVLGLWESFTIWNAGKQGRKFFRSLLPENQEKVTAFCDVDVKKIGSFYTYEESWKKIKPKVPIIHFKEAKPPLIICMKMELTDGVFEANLASVNLKEGIDYFHFS
ncbi:queuosine-tRNA galactosyltransferase-like [Cherax quadricarinatus]